MEKTEWGRAHPLLLQFRSSRRRLGPAGHCSTRHVTPPPCGAREGPAGPVSSPVGVGHVTLPLGGDGEGSCSSAPAFPRSCSHGNWRFGGGTGRSEFSQLIYHPLWDKLVPSIEAPKWSFCVKAPRENSPDGDIEIHLEIFILLKSTY